MEPGTAIVLTWLYDESGGVLVQEQAGGDGAAAEEVDVGDERGEQGWADESARGCVQTARRLRPSAAQLPLRRQRTGLSRLRISSYTRPF